MRIDDTFLTPDYYKEFVCKGGNCRHTCCQGLTINITQEEYFKLIGLECSDELRKDLDLALKPVANPDPYKYAQICPNFFGNCRMLMDNGWCKLQYECGEGVMTSVCKYFPRSPRLNISPRVSCSNGCELTLELLTKNTDPIVFEEQPLSFDLAGKEDASETVSKEELLSIQKKLFDFLERNDLTLSQKLDEIEALLCEDDTSSSTQAAVNSAVCDSASATPVSEADYLHLLAFAGAQYDTVTDYVDTAAHFLLGRSFLEEEIEDGVSISSEETQRMHAKLSESYANIKKSFPDLDMWISKMLVNDTFYKQVPFAEKKFGKAQSARILRTEARMLQILIASNLTETSAKTELIDLCMYFFRMVDFTPFGHNILVLLQA